MENQFEGQYSCEFENEVIKISARVVTKELVDHIFEFYFPDVICFDDSVEVLDERAFSRQNLALVDLESAKNVQVIGDSCFEGAFNIDCNNAFGKVLRIGKKCFKDAIILGKIEMPRLTCVPDRAFWNTDAYSIFLPSATSVSDSAFKYASTEAGIDCKVQSEAQKTAILL
ncbi:MAG: leucine-rich repeat protein [Treponema sp.]|nr:leucine-rich repeat protein [Treponema sp.]MBQ9790504.1 leucine-rich repeat protein [Clostridia bacterium]